MSVTFVVYIKSVTKTPGTQTVHLVPEVFCLEDQWNWLSTYVPWRGHEINTHDQRYVLSGLVYVHEVYTGTEWGILTIQEYVLNQVLTISKINRTSLYLLQSNHRHSILRGVECLWANHVKTNCRGPTELVLIIRSSSYQNVVIYLQHYSKDPQFQQTKHGLEIGSC